MSGKTNHIWKHFMHENLSTNSSALTLSYCNDKWKAKNVRMRNDVTPYACRKKRVNEILFMLKDDPCYIILFRRKASHISNVLCLWEEGIFVCMYFTANEDCILTKQLDYCQTTYISFSFRSCVGLRLCIHDLK